MHVQDLTQINLFVDPDRSAPPFSLTRPGSRRFARLRERRLAFHHSLRERAAASPRPPPFVLFLHFSLYLFHFYGSRLTSTTAEERRRGGRRRVNEISTVSAISELNGAL